MPAGEVSLGCVAAKRVMRPNAGAAGHLARRASLNTSDFSRILAPFVGASLHTGSVYVLMRFAFASQITGKLLK